MCRQGPTASSSASAPLKQLTMWLKMNRMTDAVYDIQLEHDVFFDLLIVAADDWEHGVYQALPIRDEVERDGVSV